MNELEQFTDSKIELVKSLDIFLDKYNYDITSTVQGRQKVKPTAIQNLSLIKAALLDLLFHGKLVPFSSFRSLQLKDVVNFGPKNGLSPREAAYETKTRVLKLGATSYGALNVNESKYIDEKIEADSHLWLVKDDILIQRGNSANFVGCNVLVEENYDGIIYPDLMMKIRANGLIDSKYLSLLLATPTSRRFMWNRMTGTSGTMPKISKKVVEAIPIILPPIETQIKVIKAADYFLLKFDELENKYIELNQISEQLAQQKISEVIS